MILERHQPLYVHAMGFAVRVTALFTDHDDANLHTQCTGDAVLAVYGDYILMAKTDDTETRVAR